MGQAALKEHIVSLSIADTFEVARKEWRLHRIEFNEEWDRCPCSQAIKEVCFIINIHNNKITHVGNVCINRFLGINTGRLFDGLDAIRKDRTSNPNEKLIAYALESGFIYPREYFFLMNISRKRKFSQKQIDWKVKINTRILKEIEVSPRISLTKFKLDNDICPACDSRDISIYDDTDTSYHLVCDTCRSEWHCEVENGNIIKFKRIA